MEPPQTPPPGGAPGSPDWNDMKGKVMAARGADRMILVAGVLFLVDSFLPWYHVSGFGVSASASGWSSGGLAILAILCAIAALALSLVQVLGKNVSLPMKAGVAYLSLGIGALVFTILRFVTETHFTYFGLYIGIVLGAVLTYAGYMKWNAEKTAAI